MTNIGLRYDPHPQPLSTSKYAWSLWTITDMQACQTSSLLHRKETPFLSSFFHALPLTDLYVLQRGLQIISETKIYIFIAFLVAKIQVSNIYEHFGVKYRHFLINKSWKDHPRLVLDRYTTVIKINILRKSHYIFVYHLCQRLQNVYVCVWPDGNLLNTTTF